MSKANRNRNRNRKQGRRRQKPKPQTNRINQPSQINQLSQKKIEQKSRFGIALGTLLKIFVGAVGILGVYISYLELIDPRISLTTNQNSNDLLKTNFVFTNERFLFTLENAKARMWVRDAIFGQGILTQNVFIDGALTELGNIEPRTDSTARFTAVDGQLERGHICILVSYQVSFWKWTIDRIQAFGYLADRGLSIDQWISRPCK
jgi:hypothetical protein